MLEFKSAFAGRVKIYSDGADRKSMLEMAANPQISGLTTNPTLMKMAGITDYRSFCKEILKEITQKPISFEVFADDFAEMKRQADEIKTWGSNVYVKIPVVNSKGESSQKLIQELSQSGVKLNVTAILTLEQVQKTVNSLIGGAPSVVSVFAGRIADTGRDPMALMMAASQMCAMDPNIELLWASCREVLNIVQAEQSGCHIITVSPDIIKKMKMFNMDLLKLSVETVQMFKNDSEAAGYRL
ncbi:MAG: transaldolase [Bdellovibrionota bacterium]